MLRPFKHLVRTIKFVREDIMNRRRNLGIFAVTLLGATFAAGNAVAQQASEMDAVEAADQAFYTALSAHDIGAM